MTKVKCKVNSCHYWGQGNICEADAIVIDQDQRRSDTTHMEVGQIGGTAKKGHTVQTSEATCCRTFRPKGSPKLS